MMNNNKLENELLHTWEETYKKGQLTLWLFLALKEGPKYVAEISEFITENSNNTISCENQSLYRTLRKFTLLKMIDFHTGPGNKGPERKYYELTDMGKSILERFIKRNIDLFFKPEIQELLKTK